MRARAGRVKKLQIDSKRLQWKVEELKGKRFRGAFWGDVRVERGKARRGGGESELNLLILADYGAAN